MSVEFLTRADLLAQGYTRRSIQAALRAGVIVRARRDRYLGGGTPDAIVRAVRVGGRLTCLSLLAMRGVFVFENHRLHVHVNPTDGRLRDPADARARIAAGRGVPAPVVHWSSLSEPGGSSCVVGIVDAAAHAVRCQSPRAAVATLDSLLHLGVLSAPELRDVFSRLPARFQVLESLVDGRAESGPETFVRLMARMLGCDIRLQVFFDGVGRVDLLLDGWLVVECDSREFHSDWGQQEVDHDRDLALAALGYGTLRLTAARIMHRPDEVFAALRGLLGQRRVA